MTVRLIRAEGLAQTVPYAYAAVAPPGSLVFTADACPIDETGTVVGLGDIERQTRQVMANLAQALAAAGCGLRAAGCGLTDVLKTTVYVASSDQHDLVTAWEVVHAGFGDHDAPSTLLGVAQLGYTGQLVEVEAMAAVPA